MGSKRAARGAKTFMFPSGLSKLGGLLSLESRVDLCLCLMGIVYIDSLGLLVQFAEYLFPLVGGTLQRRCLATHHFAYHPHKSAGGQHTGRQWTKGSALRLITSLKSGPVEGFREEEALYLI